MLHSPYLNMLYSMYMSQFDLEAGTLTLMLMLLVTATQLTPTHCTGHPETCGLMTDLFSLVARFIECCG